jgi:hypothetical protein
MLGAKEGSQPDASGHLGNQHPPTIQRKYSEPLPGHNPMVLKVSTGTGCAGLFHDIHAMSLGELSICPEDGLCLLFLRVVDVCRC